MKYFEELERIYTNKVEDQRSFNVILRNKQDGTLSIFNPPIRFDPSYRKKTYYKLLPLQSLRARAFFTLTFPQEENTAEGFENKIHEHRSIWKKVRAFIWKFLGKMSYVKTFELTKANNLHIHIICFTHYASDQLKLFADYYRRYHGHIDIKSFHYLKDDVVQTNKLWIHNTNHGVHERYCKYSGHHWVLYDVRDPVEGKNQNSYVVTNYVMKYQFKEPSLVHRAIFSKFRIRTYSTSQDHRGNLNKIQSTGKYEKVQAGFGITLEDYEKHLAALDQEEIIKFRPKIPSLRHRRYIDSNIDIPSMPKGFFFVNKRYIVRGLTSEALTFEMDTLPSILSSIANDEELMQSIPIDGENII